jgi:hypothetical protein
MLCYKSVVIIIDTFLNICYNYNIDKYLSFTTILDLRI